jgi:hypothetical protein
LKEEYFELFLHMKFGRALFNTVVTGCVWAFRMIITWASAAPSLSSVIAALAFAALTGAKRAQRQQAAEKTYGGNVAADFTSPKA